MDRRVSVVLPVRNGARTLAAAIASIRAQTFADWELLVIDDGSSDGSREIADAVARTDPRVRVMPGPAHGLVAALNAGLAAARGEFVARMDADDVSLPERFAKQVALLDARREIGLASCLVEFGGDRAANAGYALHVDWINSLITPEEIALNRFVESPLAHPSVMFRQELIARHGGYRDGDFPEDYELWLRWLEAGVQMAKVPQVLLRWNDPPDRLSRTDPRYAADAFFRLKAEWLARWLKKNLGNSEAMNPGIDHGRPSSAFRPDRKILVWGAGRNTRQRAAHLTAHGVTIAGYIDVDAKKTGRGVGGTGLPVIAPAELPAPSAVFVLGYVAVRGAREFQRHELRSRGYREGVDFLMCA